MFLWYALTALKSINRNSDKGVEIAFLGTRTGLSRTNLFVPVDQLSNRWVPPLNISLAIQREVRLWLYLMNLILCSSPQFHSVCFLRDFLTAEDKEGVFNADHFPLWYKRAAEQVPGTFVYSIPFSTGMQNIMECEISALWACTKMYKTWIYLHSAGKFSCIF